MKNARRIAALALLVAVVYVSKRVLKRRNGQRSAEYIHTSAEALKLAFADREKFLGDMDFIKIPFEGLLSKSEMAVIVIDPKTGVLHAGADPRNDAYAWAW